MIFSSIKNTNNKDEILEKILVYIRIVEVIAEKNKASIPSASISETIISELKDMGVIDTDEDLPILKNIAKDRVTCKSVWIA